MIFANQVTLCGKVVKDPIFATTKSDKTVCKIILVVEKSIGAMKRSDYIPVAMWGKKADVAKKLINKGDYLVVMGSVSQERWEASDGDKRSRIVIQADKFMMIPNKYSKENYEKEECEDDIFDNPYGQEEQFEKVLSDLD